MTRRQPTGSGGAYSTMFAFWRLSHLLAPPIRAAREGHCVRSSSGPTASSTTSARSLSASRFFTSGTAHVMNRRFEWDRIPNDTPAESTAGRHTAGLDSQVDRESNLAIAVGSWRISGRPGDVNNSPSVLGGGQGVVNSRIVDCRWDHS